MLALSGLEEGDSGLGDVVRFFHRQEMAGVGDDRDLTLRRIGGDAIGEHDALRIGTLTVKDAEWIAAAQDIAKAVESGRALIDQGFVGGETFEIALAIGAVARTVDAVIVQNSGAP